MVVVGGGGHHSCWLGLHKLGRQVCPCLDMEVGGSIVLYIYAGDGWVCRFVVVGGGGGWMWETAACACVFLGGGVIESEYVGGWVDH